MMEVIITVLAVFGLVGGMLYLAKEIDKYKEDDKND